MSNGSAGTPGDGQAKITFGSEFRRNFNIYIVFNLAFFMLLLVNKLEQSFARSLVFCGEPVTSSGPFSGSAWCGDRLLVVDQGQKLSSAGQAMECTFKVMAMVFLAVLADVFGRKPVLVLGLVCTGASALCFLGASYSPSWLAFNLFALGQGLQGAYPSELLAGIVANDLSNEPGSDPVVCQQVAGGLAMMFALLAEFTGVALNSSRSTDFAATWLLVFAANAGLACAAVLLCRETRPGDASGVAEAGGAKGGVLAAVGSEVREYGMLLRTNRVLRLNLLMFACFAISFAGKSVDMSFYLAFHGIAQTDAAKHFGVNIVLAVMFFGNVDSICQKHGSRRGFVGIIAAMNCLTLLVPFYLTSPIVFMLHQYGMMLFSGIGPLTNAVDSRWFDQRLTAKFLSMKALVQYIAGILVNPVYGTLFNAHATSWASRMAPYFLVVAAQGVQAFLLFGPLWRVPGGLPEVLDRIDRERTEKAAAAGADAAAVADAASDKKRD